MNILLALPSSASHSAPSRLQCSPFRHWQVLAQPQPLGATENEEGGLDDRQAGETPAKEPGRLMDKAPILRPPLHQDWMRWPSHLMHRNQQRIQENERTEEKIPNKRTRQSPRNRH